LEEHPYGRKGAELNALAVVLSLTREGELSVWNVVAQVVLEPEERGGYACAMLVDACGDAARYRTGTGVDLP
jgi:hypothetical protein